MPAVARPQKITLAEMRSSGVRGLLAYCADYRCSYSIKISGDGRTAQAVCTLDQQIRDHGMASFVIGRAVQVFSDIQLSVPAFMMSPEWSVNKAGALIGGGT